ncbi:aminotransferase class I/II-fold pyridoxal phosphate-dependent enzyme [Mucilaginibacter antarcticus]|uniref:Aminotransferase class I/II-fold pyridoxal phosphate-dependent enzyme n=1 Tax=Mucilaginibacter antarcticus TaxID=1855725 RepID=A0ABW5XTD3_9SPHI
MSSAENFIKQRLDDRHKAGSYRSLKPENGLLDFCSNDYLGFARSPILKTNIAGELATHKDINGATGSRLISGNLAYTEQLERDIATQFKANAALLFNSGYDANVGLLSSLPQRGDTIIADELIHASIIDGSRLSHANRYTFKHNDLEALEAKLRNAKGTCYVVVESIYSMDGDTPPLAQMVDLTERYGANLIVDEAHATGLYDTGVVTQLNIEQRVFGRIVTFGKAFGGHGAVVLGSNGLREYLINFARSLIYTTAAPLHQLAAIKKACELLPQSENEINKLRKNILLFKQLFSALDKQSSRLIGSDSAIQCVLLHNNKRARQASAYLQAEGFDVRAILSPTVAEGSERIRICLHAFNTVDEITGLVKHINILINA